MEVAYPVVDKTIQNLLNDPKECKICEEQITEDETYVLSCLHICCKRCFDDFEAHKKEVPEVKCVFCGKVIVFGDVAYKSSTQKEIEDKDPDDLDKWLKEHQNAQVEMEKLVEEAKEKVKETLEKIEVKKEAKRILIEVTTKNSLEKAEKEAHERFRQELYEKLSQQPQYTEPLVLLLARLRKTKPNSTTESLIKSAEYQHKHDEIKSLIQAEMERNEELQFKISDYTRRYGLRFDVLKSEITLSFEPDEKNLDILLNDNQTALAERINLVELIKKKIVLIIRRVEEVGALLNKRTKVDL